MAQFETFFTVIDGTVTGPVNPSVDWFFRFTAITCLIKILFKFLIGLGMFRAITRIHFELNFTYLRVDGGSGSNVNIHSVTRKAEVAGYCDTIFTKGFTT
jgi:hypothetical protein